MTHFDTNKLSMQTPDLTQANIEKIAVLFPDVVTEAEDEQGKLVKKVDFDKLRQVLSKDLVEDTTERYRLDRPGKKRALLKANTPITKTLRPVKEDSLNRDSTENLYLEGDNFEILKILQESYLGKIKMIYIDPPYNTGKDFVYKDDFKVSKDDYETEIGAKDEEGGKLFKNTDTNGRYHSDWLSMMYSRLTVARDLLKDDGVIFMSIDDNEVHNLRKLADEVFGEENFIANCIRQHSLQPKAYENRVSGHHNYTLIYGKSEKFVLGLFERTEEDNLSYSNPDMDPRGLWRTGDVRSSYAYRANLMYSITAPNGNRISSPEKGRRWSESQMKEKINTGEVIFNKEQTGIIRKIYLQDQGGRTPESIRFGKKFGTTRDGNKTIKDMFGELVFDTPKPTELIKKIVIIGNMKKNEIILDFFSGSASTAHAIMELNTEDGGNRKWIMAQLPEETDAESEAYKAGYKYITEIGKERIRRAGKKILEENKDVLAKRETPLDIGFRVYRTDSTNMKEVFYHPSTLQQTQLELFASNIKEDRTPEDLLTQVMLDLGLTLDLPRETKTIKGNTIFFVAGNSLIACFDQKIDFSIVDEIAECQPLKVVFRDASFADDKDRINVETRMKRLSPETVVSVL